MGVQVPLKVGAKPICCGKTSWLLRPDQAHGSLQGATRRDCQGAWARRFVLGCGKRPALTAGEDSVLVQRGSKKLAVSRNPLVHHAAADGSSFRDFASATLTPSDMVKFVTNSGQAEKRENLKTLQLLVE